MTYTTIRLKKVYNNSMFTHALSFCQLLHPAYSTKLFTIIITACVVYLLVQFVNSTESLVILAVMFHSFAPLKALNLLKSVYISLHTVCKTNKSHP